MLASLVAVLFYLYMKGNDIKLKYADIKDYVSVLINASAMIFAIVGLWVSSTYPTFVKSITAKDSKVKSADFGEQTRRLEGLIGVLVLSALVMSSVLVVQAIKIFIPQMENMNIIYTGVSILLTLGCFQVLAILYVILINFTYINDLYKKIHDDDIEDQF